MPKGDGPRLRIDSTVSRDLQPWKCDEPGTSVRCRGHHLPFELPRPQESQIPRCMHPRPAAAHRLRSEPSVRVQSIAEHLELRGHARREGAAARSAATLPAGVHNRLHARPCITPASVGREGTAPLKIGDTTDGDGRCDTSSATVLLTQSTSRTQLLAPSGPYPQPHHNVQYHVLSRNPAGLCCRALPMWPLCVGRPHRAHLMHTSHIQQCCMLVARL